MNSFLEYIFIKLEEEKDIVEELIIIDNKVQGTKFNISDILNFIKKNIYHHKLINLTLNNKTDILTEGDPLIVLSLLNDFPEKINKMFIDRSFVAINKWLFQKCQEYHRYDLSMNLDISYSYDEYLDSNEDILVIGYLEYVESIQDDFNRELIKVII